MFLMLGGDIGFVRVLFSKYEIIFGSFMLYFEKILKFFCFFLVFDFV